MPWGTLGGVEWGTLRLIEALDVERYQHVLLCRSDDDRVRGFFSDRGYETAVYDPVEPSFRRPGPYIASARRIARAVTRLRLDLVDAADILAACFAAAGVRLARLPLVCHVRCAYPELPWRDRRILGLVDRFAFVAEAVRDTFDVPRVQRRSDVVYDTVPIPATPPARGPLREAFGIAADRPVVGMVARLAAVKDYPTLVSAAKQVVAAVPDALFVIIGDNAGTQLAREHYARVVAWLKDAALEDRFLFTGYRADVASLWGDLDVVTLPSTSEGFPLVLMEAMAAGRPVVATRVGGVPELIEHGRTGLLHEMGDADALARDLTRLLRDRDLAAALGAAARDDVADRFTPAALRERTEAVYARLLR